MDMQLVGLTIFVACNFIDYQLTKKILARGGEELNPIVRKIMAKFGYIGVALMKSFIVLIFITQYLAAKLDMFVIWYLCLIYLVFNSIMYIQLRRHA